jgi:CheY-like chemotaxis protein
MNINSDGLVMASYTQLHQIILNLCTNAGHAMEDQGGILTVNLDDVVRDVLPAQHRRVTDGAYVKLSVSDTGMGMTTEILSKAFTPFFTTRKQGEGVGMGLPTVHGIVTTLNGWILPKSEPGKGSEFEVYLPVVGQDRRRRPKSIVTSGDRGIILFVDDEEPILKLGKIVLEQHGYKVDTAARSREALELFRKTPEKYTLVITDLRMPVMTGEELARQIHLIRPETPIILCTGFDKSISEEMAMKSGFKAVVSKPILADEVTEAIGRVLGQVRQ